MDSLATRLSEDVENLQILQMPQLDYLLNHETSVPILRRDYCKAMDPFVRIYRNAMPGSASRVPALYFSFLLSLAIARQILQSANGIDCFKGLDILCTAGGPLSRAAGDLISRAAILIQLYGSTEAAILPLLMPSPEDWEYMEWHPVIKHEMRVTDHDDTIHELALYMDSETEKTAALNHNLPGAKEYSTRDLFQAHPTKPGLWRFYGRNDDIIVLGNSAEFFPVTMETKLQRHPLLCGALVIGRGRSRPALLGKTKEEEVSDQSPLLEKLWPAVEGANTLVPHHGRIIRPLILVASAQKKKPFVRAGKGPVVRNLTQRQFTRMRLKLSNK
ncbi:MAG: hypothetical protein Q9173_007165 [Seirophora scorigena]